MNCTGLALDEPPTTRNPTPDRTSILSASAKSLKSHVFRCSAARWPTPTIPATTIPFRAASQHLLHEFTSLAKEQGKQHRCTLREPRLTVCHDSLEARRNVSRDIRALLPGLGWRERATQRSTNKNVHSTDPAITTSYSVRQSSIQRKSNVRWNRRIQQSR